MRVLVLGGGGQVGRAVAAIGSRAAPGHRQDVVRNSISPMSARSQRAVAEAGADWIVNGAAYTAVDLAEDQPALATAVNDTAVGVLARGRGARGRRLLHLSTDFVFDGKSNRAYLPTDATGSLERLRREQTRRRAAGAAERRAAGSCCAPPGCTPPRGKNFVLTMLRLMREREQVKVVCDQIGTPTWAGGLARAIWGLIDADAPAGVYHWTDLGVASWYDFAVAIQDEALARGLLARAVPDRAHHHRRIPDARAAAGVQRARYLGDARARSRAPARALAPQLKDDVE